MKKMKNKGLKIIEKAEQWLEEVCGKKYTGFEIIKLAKANVTVGGQKAMLVFRCAWDEGEGNFYVIYNPKDKTFCGHDEMLREL